MMVLTKQIKTNVCDATKGRDYFILLGWVWKGPLNKLKVIFIRNIKKTYQGENSGKTRYS